MTTTDTAVLAADDRRFAAMRNEDWASLDAVLADDLTYVHSSARLESKAEHIANLQARKPQYRGVTPRERVLRINGEVGIINGIADIHADNAGKEARFTVRYLALYTKSAAGWRLSAWQSTRIES